MTLRDINILQLMLSCIFWELDNIEAALDTLETFPRNDFLIPRFHLRRVYTGLGAVALGRERNLKRFSKLGEDIMKEVKADIRHSSVNDYPILLMLQAEETPSLSAYADAIRACDRIGLIHHEAYMYERAGAFLITQNNMFEAGEYLSKAEERYSEWGAAAKVRQMHSVYGSVMRRKDSAGQYSSLNVCRHRSIMRSCTHNVPNQTSQESLLSMVSTDGLSVRTMDNEIIERENPFY
jgi:hypothetical protein